MIKFKDLTVWNWDFHGDKAHLSVTVSRSALQNVKAQWDLNIAVSTTETVTSLWRSEPLLFSAQQHYDPLSPWVFFLHENTRGSDDLSSCPALNSVLPMFIPTVSSSHREINSRRLSKNTHQVLWFCLYSIALIYFLLVFLNVSVEFD